MAFKLLRFSCVKNMNLCFLPGKDPCFDFLGKCLFHAAKSISTYGIDKNYCCNHLKVSSNFLDKVYFQVPLRSNSVGNTQSSLRPEKNINRRSTENEIVFKHLIDEKESEIKSFLCLLSEKESYCQSDWENLKDLVLSAGKVIKVNNKNVETITMKYISKYNHLNLAKSYLSFLQNQNTNVNTVTVSVYLRLMYKCWRNYSPNDINVVESLCDELLKAPLLECKVAESLIFGLCLTKRWKESFKVIEKFKELYDFPFSSYSAIIKAAFMNNEIDFGLKLLEEKMSDGFTAHQSIYECLLENSADKKAVLNILLTFLAKHNEELDVSSSGVILQQVRDLQLKETSTTLLAAKTQITNKGVCRHCENYLKSAVLSAEEFEKLKSLFLDSVLVGKDVFRKTNPEELKRFKKFVNETGPYDFVLDGLNIAYAVGFKNKSNDVFADMLKTVVQFFVRKNNKILILGRKHMTTWPKRPIEYIKNNAHLFLIDDLSQDDPYLLYAALLSGMNCNFVSRDLMRGHKYLFNLHNPDLNSLFWRWQCTHQYILIFILKNGEVILKKPITHLQRAHFVKKGSREGRWHVPCSLPDDSFVPGHRKFNTKLWLCLPEL